MRVIREIKVVDRDVLVKELTLKELRAWLAAAGNYRVIDLVDELFDDQDLLVSDIPYFTDLDAEFLGNLAPSEIAPVVEEIRAVNSRFFVTWQRRMEEMRRLAKTAPLNSTAALPA